ncbi:LysR family transcriptional regulator [Sciscionella marina]|uniref:LysR family transcriptional regulator n=1 Tax=Sciscionella marina TaxID=508770 RepID=UPI000A023B75|nr:LysR family transcriptional regulator [Sciscionella marina]
MELRSLRYFLAVCESSSINGAARRLHMTQPALSRAIASLEREFGTRLFERSSEGLRISAAGKLIQPIARDLVERAQLGQRLIHSYTTGTEMEFRVICPESTVRLIVAPFLAETSGPIKDAFTCADDEVYDRIRRQDADFGICALAPPVDLVAAPIGRIGVTAYLRPDHPLAGSETIDITDLAGCEVIMREPGNAIRVACDRALAKLGHAPRVVAETSSVSMSHALAWSGHGVGLTLGTPQYGVTMRRLVDAGEPIFVTYYAIWQGTHYAADRLAELGTQLTDWFLHGEHGDAAITPRVRADC